MAETCGRLEVNSTACFANFFEPGHNRLGTMRHVLALAVLVDHSLHLGGFPHLLSSTPYKNAMGGIAVAGFFVLSGALITASWEHSRTVWQFARNRVLRIFPGYLVCLLVTALVIGPLAWAVQSSPEVPAYWKLEPGPAVMSSATACSCSFRTASAASLPRTRSRSPLTARSGPSLGRLPAT